MGKELDSWNWKATLAPEQRTKLDHLRVRQAKSQAPLRAKIMAMKTDLAVLATADEPDTGAIQQHIDELLALKKQLMQQRYAHIAAVRRMLTEEQRPSFDMMVLKRVKKRKMTRH